MARGLLWLLSARRSKHLAVLGGTFLVGCTAHLGDDPEWKAPSGADGSGHGDGGLSPGAGGTGTSGGEGTPGTGGPGTGDGTGNGDGSGIGDGTGDGSGIGDGSGDGSGTGDGEGDGAGGGAGGNPSGGGSGPGPGPSSSPFKGIAYNTPCSDLSLLGATWFYNWSSSTNCNPANGAEYVPMIWGASAVNNIQQVINGGHTTLLGFNEPDLSAQANLTVQQAINLWPQLEATGLRLGSPATASNPAGENWLAGFMQQVQQNGLRVDFIAVHWYGWGAGGCENINAHFTHYMERIMSYGLPVWLTEWGCYNETAANARAFYNAAVAWMLARPQIERHAWFLTRGVPGESAWNAQRLVDGNGQLTALGQDYQASQGTR